MLGEIVLLPVTGRVAGRSTLRPYKNGGSQEKIQPQLEVPTAHNSHPTPQKHPFTQL